MWEEVAIINEESRLKARVCHGCGKHGVSYDKRNCPDLHDEYVKHV